MSHHDNIQMLRALGHALGDTAAARVVSNDATDTGTKQAEQVARFIICDLATSCLRAADDIQEQHRLLVERMSGGGPAG